MQDKAQALQKNQQQLLITAVLDGFAILAIGFGIFTKASSGDASANSDVVNMVLGGGIAVAFWCAWRLFSLIRQRSQLMRD